MSYLKELMKNKTAIKKSLKPGRLVIYSYNAKDKTQKYDKRPFVFVLRTSGSYMLGINFNWLPPQMRFKLVETILKVNAKNIKNPINPISDKNSRITL